MERLALALAVLGLASPGCAPPLKLAYSADQLEALIRARLPEVPEQELAVPFAVGEAALARARALTARLESRLDRAEALKEALFSESGFGLTYAEGVTGTAQETLARGSGNCLSLAAVYVGLARGLGLKAFFLDASARVEELHQEEELLVRSGHVTAVVETEQGKQALDFASQLGGFLLLRVMDDVEATAHFYNNRGYELIVEARARGNAEPWTAVARQFRLAAQVKPDFARAWNNLGVALAKLGRPEEARTAYQLAALHDPAFASPRVNLALLELAAGEPAAALAPLAEALRLEPEDARARRLLLEACARVPAAEAACRRSPDAT